MSRAKNAHGLTSQMEQFAAEVASGKGQSEAYRIAYPTSKKWAAKTVHIKASMLAADGMVKRRIDMLRDKRQARLAEKSILKAEDVLTETARLMSVNPGRTIKREVVDGRERATVLLPDELDPDTAAAVASFEMDDMGRVKYRFWDKNTALERAARILGQYAKDNRQRNPAAELFAALGLGRAGAVVVGPAPGAAEFGDADGAEE